MAEFVYLSKEVLTGLDNYKYSAVDTSPVSKYICHPFWNQIVKLCPLWIAPNVLTLTGFLLLLVNFIILTYYDMDFYASSRDHPEYLTIPNWVWLVGALNNFLSHSLDGIDGKQARRTKSSSPLGELFDHGLDSWATFFLPVAVYSIFGRGELGVDIFRAYLIVVGIMICFIISHWEKYNTGILFLPWGYDIGQIGMSAIYFVTFLGGYDMWKFTLPVVNLSAAALFELMCHVGFFGLTFPFTFYNVYRAYSDKTGKMRPFSEAMRPLVSTILLFTLLFVWVFMSSYNILEKQPRLVFWTTGTAFSNIACKLIIAQMSNTRCELLNSKLLPLFTIVCMVCFLNLGYIEYYLLWSYCIFITITHVIFGVCVVRELCDHFKIRAFSIPAVSED
ncbi:ethanolaminephosphotransferase 1-like [Gigantopelta aegis]|uniref:ethanolaminephosphotransferase 1-like n=1 Tax=Gigantopelta aegis TaxID=1735272 RepID=UPI001B88A49B|nr:ethanolaminephosphotransferase 1-like [Gigantopelta aegis]